jgi:SOS-response transcriptional repressor LexA
MTPLQRKAYDFIDRFWSRNGYAPSYREIQEGLELKAVSGVHRLIVSLIEREFVKTTPGKKRSVVVIKVQKKRGVRGSPTTAGGSA